MGGQGRKNNAVRALLSVAFSALLGVVVGGLLAAASRVGFLAAHGDFFPALCADAGVVLVVLGLLLLLFHAENGHVARTFREFGDKAGDAAVANDAGHGVADVTQDVVIVVFTQDFLAIFLEVADEKVKGRDTRLFGKVGTFKDVEQSSGRTRLLLPGATRKVDSVGLDAATLAAVTLAASANHVVLLLFF